MYTLWVARYMIEMYDRSQLVLLLHIADQQITLLVAVIIALAACRQDCPPTYPQTGLRQARLQDAFAS